MAELLIAPEALHRWTVDLWLAAGSSAREAQLTAAHMDPAHLGAPAHQGKHLARIQQTLGVEGAFQSLLLVQVDIVELIGHQVPLLHPHPMFAGQHAAELLKNALPRLYPVQFRGARPFSSVRTGYIRRGL